MKAVYFVQYIQDAYLILEIYWIAEQTIEEEEEKNELWSRINRKLVLKWHDDQRPTERQKPNKNPNDWMEIFKRDEKRNKRSVKRKKWSKILMMNKKSSSIKIGNWISSYVMWRGVACRAFLFCMYVKLICLFNGTWVSK